MEDFKPEFSEILCKSKFSHFCNRGRQSIETEKLVTEKKDGEMLHICLL